MHGRIMTHWPAILLWLLYWPLAIPLKSSVYNACKPTIPTPLSTHISSPLGMLWPLPFERSAIAWWKMVIRRNYEKIYRHKRHL